MADDIHNTATTNAPLLSTFADDPDMLELVEMFVEEMDGRVKDIEAAIEGDDLASLAKLAHQLKGCGGGYGFPKITEVASVVEQQAKTADDRDALLSGVKELTSLCKRASANSA